VTGPEADDSLPAEPVENTMAQDATLARGAFPAWHRATVARHSTLAPHATLERYAIVRGELRVPNTLNFSLFPTLDPFAKAVYYQLFLLSHGFRRDTCLVSLPKLAKSVLMSQRKVQNTIAYLETRGLIERLESKLGGPARGNLYRVPLPCAGIAPDAAVAQGATLAGDATLVPHATLAQGATVARGASNKENLDDDDLKTNHHQRAETSQSALPPVENHSRAAAPRESPDSSDLHFSLVRAAYEKTTGNRWRKSDFDAYEENGLRKLPAETIISAVEAVGQRTPVKINLFGTSSRSWWPSRIQATALGERNSSQKSCAESRRTSSAAPTIRLAISSRTSSAPAPGKPSPSTTTFSTNWCGELTLVCQDVDG
jgi:hypothetical protein